MVGAPVRVEDRTVIIGGRSLTVGDTVTIDGTTGEIFAGQIPGRSVVVPEAETLLAWAKEQNIDINHPDTETAALVLVGEPTASEVMRALAIKEVASPSALASAILSTPEQVRTLLDQLASEGLITLGRDVALSTEAGRAKGRELIAADRERWGIENAVAALDVFLRLDAPVKETVTAWQLWEVDGQSVPNDHTDMAYDASVLDSLTTLHEDVVEWSTPLVNRMGRLDTYARRLDRALDLARQGDQRFVASARVDSYHSVWFELHEDLIRLSGRTREDEVAAGRA